MENEWEIRVFEQPTHPPFKQWCAIAEKQLEKQLFMVNAEGDTPELAILALKRRIKESGY